MTYPETLKWMFAQLPVYQEKGAAAFNGKLDNIKSFATHLDNPERKFKSIHVAGTNGKGSSSHMLASILQEAGYKVGLYTSPHLKDFRERIRINGRTIDESFVIDFIDGNKSFLETQNLSFFEMTVGMAFDYFSREEVDVAVIEVGLGGRLDSTNIIIPEVSLITNIGIDHTDFLGDTMAKIAFEKAGVIKENVPVVISEYQKEAAVVFNRVADEKNTALVYAETQVKEEYKTSLLGLYQTKNVKGVVATIEQLKHFSVSNDAIKNGLNKVVENTGLMGRWQMLQENPKIVCDTAHNTEGLGLVMEQLSNENYSQLHIVLGFVEDKNLDSVLPLFPKNAIYYFCCPKISRGLAVELLVERAMNFDLKGMLYDSVNEAFEAAKIEARKTDFIYVGGSTFVVAEVV